MVPSNGRRDGESAQIARAGSRGLDATTVAAATVLVAFSGSPFLQQWGWQSAVFGFAAIAHAIWIARPRTVPVASLILVGGFAVVVLFHIFAFGSVVFATSMGRILLLWSTVVLVAASPRWHLSMVPIMALLSVVSIILMLPVWLGVSPQSIPSLFLGQDGLYRASSIGIQTYMLNPADRFRNAGFFWEPGAFSGYLVLALVFLLSSRGFSSVEKRNYGLAISAGVISTQSTGGYICGLLVFLTWLISRIWKSRQNWRAASAMSAALVLLFAGSIWAIDSLPFLGEKISGEVHRSRVREENWQISRTGNLIYDMHFIAKRPLSGWSSVAGTRSDLDTGATKFAAGQGNGLSGTAVKYGVPWLVIYLLYVARSGGLAFRDRLTGSLMAVCVASLLMYEQFLNFPLFIALAVPSSLTLVARRSGTTPRSIGLR